MEITPIGGVLIPLGALLFLLRPNLLYWCAIFFLPFSATAVVNVGSEGNFSGLQAWMFFGSLWLAKEASHVIRTRALWYTYEMRRSARRLLFFFVVALVSLVMPLWIDGRLWIQSATLDSDEARPLFFNMQHVTQILYLANGVLFAIFVGVKNLDFAQFRRTVRIFLFSSIFVSLWGLLQWCCFWLGVDYPAFLLNTNKHEAAMGYLRNYDDLGVARISSVATEPSVLAQCLLIVLVFAMFALLSQKAFISRFWDRIVVVLTVFVLLLTTSSTAYIGMALLIPVFLVTFSRLGKLRRWHVVSIAALLIACAAVYARSFIVQDLADTALFSKAGSYSGLERLNSVLLAAGYFRQYPLLGVGWGTVTSHDLIFKLLADVGLVGLAAFAMFLKSLASGLWGSVPGIRGGANMGDRSYWSLCLLMACGILIVTSALSEFAYVFGHVWFVFGLGLAIPQKRAAQLKVPSLAAQQVPA